jgi:hypothetical protein
MITDEWVAHELAQEAILQAYLSLNHLRDATRFKSWLYGITLNICRSYLHDRKMDILSLETIMGGVRSFTFPGFEIQQIVQGETILTIIAHATSTTAVCPTCQQVSNYVHSYYIRSPQDLPVSGRRVRLVLQVRRFRCQNQQCPRQTITRSSRLRKTNKPFRGHPGEYRGGAEWTSRLAAD